MALLAWLQGLTGTVVSPTNFFAAYAQFLVAWPLYLFAEPIVDVSTREAARQFLSCELIQPDDRPAIEKIHAAIRRARLSPIAEFVLVAVAYAFSLAVLLPHYLGTALPTWHVHSVEGVAFPLPTAPGFWLFLVALPLLNYIWLRMIWKILLWTW